MATTATDRLNGINEGVAIKAPVRVATTANITLSGAQTIDGVAVVADDRVLVKNQTDTTENGIYIAASSTWSRSPDFDGSRDIVQGTLVYAISGTVGGNVFYMVSTASPVVGSALAFTSVNTVLSGVSAFMETVVDDTTASAARTTLGAFGSSTVRGADCLNNSGTPNTQFDLSAASVCLIDSSGGTMLNTSPGTITNNILTAGSTANGRDQAGAFTNGSWVHFWWIWNGTTLASLSSASATAPTLPSGYTHKAYAGAVYLSAGGALVKTRIKGAWALTEGKTNVLTGGTATVETAISLTAAIPSNALEFQASISIGTTGNATSAQNTATYRVVSGTDFQQFTDRATSAFAGSMVYQGRFPNISQNLYYLNTKVTDGTLNSGVDIQGYKLPNGGE